MKEWMKLLKITYRCTPFNRLTLVQTILPIFAGYGSNNCR